MLLQCALNRVRKLAEVPEPSPLRELQDYWLQHQRWHSALTACLAQLLLANCQAIDVDHRAGVQMRRCRRVAPAIVLPAGAPHAVWSIASAIARVMGAPTLRLQVDAVAGIGANCTTLRGVYLGLPVALKFDNKAGRSAIDEWERLERLDAVRSGNAGALPIPFYYGLFESPVGFFSVMSDNGVSLAQHPFDSELTG